jgi:hypothetical protein
MMKSGASQKTVPLRMQELSLTTAPRSTTQIECASPMAATSSIIRTNSLVVAPFAQARDAAQQEAEEEHADPNLRKVTIKRRKKGLRSSTNMDFMRHYLDLE